MDFQRILEYQFDENLCLIFQFFHAFGRKNKNKEVKFAFHQIACSRKN